MGAQSQGVRLQVELSRRVELKRRDRISLEELLKMAFPPMHASPLQGPSLSSLRPIPSLSNHSETSSDGTCPAYKPSRAVSRDLVLRSTFAGTSEGRGDVQPQDKKLAPSGCSAQLQPGQAPGAGSLYSNQPIVPQPRG